MSRYVLVPGFLILSTGCASLLLVESPEPAGSPLYEQSVAGCTVDKTWVAVDGALAGLFGPVRAHDPERHRRPRWYGYGDRVCRRQRRGSLFAVDRKQQSQ